MRATVLGAGISGLTTAEALSRNDFDVTVRDVNTWIGGDASLATQNWYHTGWLYAAMPNPAPTNGCAEAALLLPRYYPSWLSRDWVREGGVQVVYAIRTHELSWWQRIGWPLYVRGRVMRRMDRLTYGGERREHDPRVAGLMSLWENELVADDRYWTVASTDGHLDSLAVIDGLAGRIRGGAILGTEPELRTVSDRTVVDGELYDLVVLASGSGLRRQLESIDSPLAKNISSVVSPVAVFRQPLDLPNFIRYTPKVAHTVNHFRFDTPDGPVSTVGAYDYWSVDEMRPPEPFMEKVCRLLGRNTNEVSHVYYATKTEYTNGADRRYNHAVVRVNKNTVLAVPGKFSQFPLLAKDFAQTVKLDMGRPPIHGRAAIGPIGRLRAQRPTNKPPWVQPPSVMGRSR